MALTFRPGRRIAAGAAAVVLLLLAAWAWGGLLLARGVKAAIIHTLRSRAGIEVSVVAVRFPAAGELEIAGLHLDTPDAASPITALAVERLSLRYRLPLLLRHGREAFLLGAALSAEGVVLAIDLRRTSPPGPGSPEGIAFPGLPLPALRLADAALQVRGDGFEAGLDGLCITSGPLPPDGGRILLEARQARWAIDGLSPGGGRLEAALALAPQGMAVERLDLDGRRVVERAALGRTADAAGLAFTAALHLGGGSAEIDGRLVGSQLAARLRGREVDLGRLLGAAARLRETAAAGRIDFEVDLAYDFESGPASASGRLDLTLRQARLNGVAVEQADLEAALAAGRLTVRRLALAAGGTTAHLEEFAAPVERLFPLDLPALARESSGRLALRSENLPALLSLFGIASPVRPPPDHRLTVDAGFGAGLLTVAEARLEAGANRIRVRHLNTALAAPGPDTPLSAEIAIDWPDLASLAAFLPLPPLTGTLAGGGVLAGTFGRPRGELRLAGRRLGVGGYPAGDLVLRAAGEIDRIRIDPLLLERGADRIEARGVLRPAEARIEEAAVELAIADLAPYTALLPPALGLGDAAAGRLTARVAGRLALSGPLADPDGTLALDLAAVRLAGRRLGDGRARIAKRGDAIVVESFEMAKSDDRLTARGSLDIRRRTVVAAVAELRVTDVAGYLNGATGDAAPRGAFAPQALEAVCEIAGPWSAPAFDLTARVGRLGRSGLLGALAAEGRLRYAERTLRVSHLALTGPRESRLEIAGSVPVGLATGPQPAPGEIALAGRLRIPESGPALLPEAGWPIAAGSLAADFEIGGSWPSPTGKLVLSAEGLTAASELTALPPGPFRLQAAARLERNRLVLERLAADGPATRLSAAGIWAGVPEAGRLLAGEALGVGGGEIDLALDLAVEDLSWIGRRIAGLRRTAGRLEVGVRIAGTLPEPETSVEIRLSGAALRPEATGFPPLEALTLHARSDGRRLEILQAGGELGGAPFRLSGAIEGLRAPIAAGAFDLRLDGENLLLFRSDDATLRADARLALTGPVARPTLSGRLAVSDGRFTRRLRVADAILAPSGPRRPEGLRLFAIEAPPLADTRFDVRIEAARPLRVRAGIAGGELTPDLTLRGTGRAPALTGAVAVQEGWLRLPAGRLTIDHGLISLPAGDPIRPVLDLSGSSRLYGHEVSAFIEGPYDAPRITLSSVPPLPNEDLLLMLLAGRPPRAAAVRDADDRLGVNVAVFVGRDFITRWLDRGDPESEESILERFDVQVGRAISRRGQETIDARFTLLDDLLGTPSALYLTGEKDIYDHYNAGVRLVFRFR